MADQVRFGEYKAIYQTGGESGCCESDPGNATCNVGPSKRHNPPLLFDLSKDPAEAR